MLNYAIYFFSLLRPRTAPRQLGSRKSSQGVIRYPRGVRSFTGITPTRAGGVHEPGSTKPNHQPCRKTIKEFEQGKARTTPGRRPCNDILPSTGGRAVWSRLETATCARSAATGSASVNC